MNVQRGLILNYIQSNARIKKHVPMFETWSSYNYIDSIQRSFQCRNFPSYDFWFSWYGDVFNYHFKTQAIPLPDDQKQMVLDEVSKSSSVCREAKELKGRHSSCATRFFAASIFHNCLFAHICAQISDVKHSV